MPLFDSLFELLPENWHRRTKSKQVLEKVGAKDKCVRDNQNSARVGVFGTSDSLTKKLSEITQWWTSTSKSA
jgi:hypothetical protein